MRTTFSNGEPRTNASPNTRSLKNVRQIIMMVGMCNTSTRAKKTEVATSNLLSILTLPKGFSMSSHCASQIKGCNAV